VGEDDRLEGVIVRGALIAGLTTSTEQHDEGGEDFSGVGVHRTDEVRSESAGRE
jgi:hypothetical protein